MAQDRSRSAFDVRSPKHWSGLQAQQGRLLSDDDWNEADAIAQDDARHTRAHVIGPAGSPDDGFKLANPRVAGSAIDFDLLPGSIYVGGLRATLEQSEVFSQQRDWLQQPATERPAPGTTERIDLAYLEVWQQPVTAVEDNELQEIALGGPDTSVRIRTMRRVHLRTGVASENCPAEWAKVAVELGGLTADNELVNNASLTLGYVPYTGPATDLCSPGTPLGYLGAENQAIRIEIGGKSGADNTFLWGFDNASPLYRVQVTSDGAISFLTPPKDESHWPLAGQIVELLPWSAVLPNGEKVAETSGGLLTRVSASYDPNTQTIKVTSAVSSSFGAAWKARADATSLGTSTSAFLYLRVWNRGADTASAPEIPFKLAPSIPVQLAGTGLQVTFSGTSFRRGDFWIIAARPESPAKVVPWNLEKGRLAEGIRRFYAPLGLIHWRPGTPPNAIPTATVIDGRDKFAPLTRLRSCSVTVSPLPGWEHILDKIADNDDLSLCFEPGDYTTTRTLVLRNKNVKLHGAGGATRIHGAGIVTVLQFRGCSHVEIGDLAIDADTAIGERAGTITTIDCDHVAISGVTARCASGPVKIASCILIYSGTLPADRVRASSARVQGCELIVGANQIGLSVISYGHTTISDNVVRVDPTENAAIPDAWLRDAGFRSHFRRALIYRHGLVKQITRDGKTTTNVPPGAVEIDMYLGGPRVWLETAPPLASAWTGVFNARTFTRSRINRVTFGEYLHDLADALISSGGYLSTAHGTARFGEVFKNYLAELLALRSTTTGVRTLAAQGIVVAGTTAHDVRISGNLVRDTPQGIHVACSASHVPNPKPGEQVANTAGRVVVSNNTVHVTLMPESVVERHGIFIGNCKSLVIEDNHLECERLGAGARLNIDGIRCYGYLGKMAYITRNDMIGFPTGIRFAPINDATDGATSLWKAIDNIASDANPVLNTALKKGPQPSHVIDGGNGVATNPLLALQARLKTLEDALFMPAFDPPPSPQLEPRTVTPGQRLVLHGRNFNARNPNSSISGIEVKIGSGPVTVTAVTATTVTVLVPLPITDGSYEVSIKTPGGGPVTAYERLTVSQGGAADPLVPTFAAINDVAPAYGFVGQTVVLTGTNFDQPGLTVLFEGLRAPITSTSPTQIMVRVPELGNITRSFRITVTTVRGIVTSATQFQFRAH